ncbi:MAG: DUF2326 domain-containing protein [Alphaproteobacteria bacterium]|nr:DUF2326 domain-containing protein [Alphaproteobacteria bacterium]
MLYRLTANRQSFKTIEFRKGLNIILADRQLPASRDEAAPQRRTRNGAGKSSIIDLVHFLLAGSAEGALKSDALAEWVFELSLDLDDERLAVRRGQSGGRVTIRKEGPGFVSDTDPTELTNAAWTTRLGKAWFRLANNRQPGAASFRQLISYFARRRRDGGYDDPVRTFRAQSNAVIETNLAVLFGLDAEIVRRFHQAKNALKQIQIAQKALRDLESAAPAGTRRVDLEAALSAQIAAATLARDYLSEQINSFNVLPVFRELEQELASLNERGRDLSDEDVLDRESVDANRRALEAEEQDRAPRLEALFAEAKIVFPDVVNRRYEEVVRFHHQLIENRQAQLLSEIASAQRRIEERRPDREQVEVRRRQITAALRSGGPADELLRLRDELSEKEGVVRALEARLNEARRLEKQAEDTQQELEETTRALRQDRRERDAIAYRASRTFSEISKRLYEKPGELVISANEQGLRFVPSIPSSQSAGVMSMQIFCFDFTVASLCRSRGMGPGFLIHDSHLYEPVDGRQFARALRIGAEYAEEIDLQYIVTLNSDELTRAESEGGDDFRSFVLDPILSDVPQGGLFGIRFD